MPRVRLEYIHRMKGWSGCAKLCPSGSLRMPHSTHTYRDIACAEMCALVLPRYAHRGQTTCVKERVLHVRQSAPEGVTPHVYRNMPFRLAKVCPNGSRHTATLKPYYQNSVFKAVFFCPALVGVVVFCHFGQLTEISSQVPTQLPLS